MILRSILTLLVALSIPTTALADGARYLIVTPAEWADEMEPLAEWKTRKGMLAKVVTPADTGYSSYEIRAYIQDAVATWDPAPEYVLLVGDMHAMPMEWANDGWGGYSDTYYGSVDGDTFIEIHPGRFPAGTAIEVAAMVEKTLQYERYPTPSDDPFYRSALLVLSEDWDDDDWLHYYGDANWESGLLTEAGYDSVSLLTRGTTPNGTQTATDILEGGVSFAAYHGVPTGSNAGWNGFDIVADSLDNGPMLPIVPVYTCQTVCGWSYGGENWVLAGDASTLRGAVAYVGQSISCSYCAHWRSAMRRGFWGLIFEDTDDTEIVTMGAAVEEGRLGYYNEFHATDQYVGSVLFGDPELNIWTGPPRDMAISYPSLLPRSEGEVTLSASLEGHPREGVRICLHGDADTYAYGLTDETGSITLAVDTRNETVVHLTATGRNMRPVEVQIDVADAPSPADDDDDDTTGDDDDATPGDDDDDITGDDDDIADDDDDDDDDDVANVPGGDINIGSGQCECRVDSRPDPAPMLALAALIVGLIRRRS